MIPSALGIHDPNRAMAADAQTVDSGAEASVWPGRHQAAVFDLILQRFVGRFADFRRAASRPRTQEHMAMILAQAVFGFDVLQILVGFRHRYSFSSNPRNLRKK